MFELRWLVRGTDRVLQYRQRITMDDYTDLQNGVFGSKQEWSAWRDVPEFTE